MMVLRMVSQIFAVGFNSCRPMPTAKSAVPALLLTKPADVNKVPYDLILQCAPEVVVLYLQVIAVVAAASVEPLRIYVIPSTFETTKNRIRNRRACIGNSRRDGMGRWNLLMS